MNEIIFPSVVTNVDGKDQSMNLITHELLSNRVIYLTGEINDMTALNVITQLRLLAGRSDDDIVLFINSPGGSVTAGLAICDTMNTVMQKCDICTVCLGLGASMGAILLAGGTRGKRYAAPNAAILIHQPLGGVQGQATDISLMADHIQLTKKKLASILADACGKPAKILLRDMERDNWKSAEEAKKYGLIDHIGFPDRTQEIDYE